MNFPNQDILQKYAEITVKIGLNLQPGQTLIIQDYRRGGVPIVTAPMIREITRSAYQAGAQYVDVQWRDDQHRKISFEEAPRGSFNEVPVWQVQGTLDVIENGGAMLTVYSEDPDLLSGQDPDLIAAQQKTILKNWKPVSDHVSKDTMNWSLISIPIPGWARKVFPDLAEEQQVPALWEILIKLCRINEENPTDVWEKHIIQLIKRSEYLNQKAYQGLQYQAPGTDLYLGLPEGHIWKSARFTSQSGIPFSANIPTEEVFTLPDKRLTEGTVTATKPLVYGGNVINDFSLTFKEGKVVDHQAKEGDQILKDLLAMDDGSRMLGEVALVPDSSPISQSGMLFYNTLFDENASCHLALGNAYDFTLEGREKMTKEEFLSRGGNDSLIHQDFMIGSNQLNVDGIRKDGKTEPILRKGEWAFSI